MKEGGKVSTGVPRQSRTNLGTRYFKRNWVVLIPIYRYYGMAVQILQKSRVQYIHVYMQGGRGNVP